MNYMDSSFPGLIEWTPTYSVGIDSIDNQHRLLVSMIRHLQEAMIEGRARQVVLPLIGAMNQYWKFHFAYEEELLKSNDYPQLASHLKQHADLVAKLHELEQKYSDGNLSAGGPLMQFLRRWLLDHLAVDDMQYAEFLKGKGVC